MRLGPALLLVALLLLSPQFHLTTIATAEPTTVINRHHNHHHHDNHSSPVLRNAGRKQNLFDDHPSTTSNHQKAIGKDVLTNNLDHYDDYHNSSSLGKFTKQKLFCLKAWRCRIILILFVCFFFNFQKKMKWKIQGISFIRNMWMMTRTVT